MKQILRCAVLGIGLTTVGGPVLTANVAQAAVDVSGFGNDVPLSLAARQIVPREHSIYFATNIDKEMLVDWQGGKEWKQILQELASDNGLKVTVSDGAVKFARARSGKPVEGAGITILEYEAPARYTKYERPAPPPPKAPATSDVDEDRTPSSVENNLVRDEAYQPFVGSGQKSTAVWSLPAGGSLRTTLEEWAEKAGWSVVWNSVYEYPIQAGADFHGSFIEATTTVIESMASVKPSVKAAFYKKNRVLVIETSVDEQG